MNAVKIVCLMMVIMHGQLLCIEQKLVFPAYDKASTGNFWWRLPLYNAEFKKVLCRYHKGFSNWSEKIPQKGSVTKKKNAINKAHVHNMQQCFAIRKVVELHGQLLNAIRLGRIECIAALLSSSNKEAVDPESALDDIEAGPLHHAASWGNTKAIAMLIDHVGRRGKESLKKFLVARDMYGRNALHWAIARGQLDAIKLLLALTRMSGVSLVFEKDNAGRTPLHWAAGFPRVDHKATHLIDVLKHDSKFEDALFEKDMAGMIPYSYSVASQDTLALQKLSVSKAAYYGNIKNIWGHTPFHIAAMTHNSEFFRTYAAANPFRNNAQEIFEQDDKGNTALHLAVRSAKKDLIVQILSLNNKKIEIKRLIMMPNKNKKTALDIARDLVLPDLVALLESYTH